MQEGVSLPKGIGVVLIAVGTFLMIEKKQSSGETKSAAWLWYALGSAVFASLTAILGKIGISGIESNLGTAIRTAVVLVMSWVMVFVTGKQGELKAIPQNELGLHLPVRSRYRRQLALLLQGVAGRPCPAW